MVQLVLPQRLFEGSVFGVVLMFCSAFGLHSFGLLHGMVVVVDAKSPSFPSQVFDTLFPFPKQQYQFNLTHILLFAILITVLCFTHHPAPDVIVKDQQKRNEFPHTRKLVFLSSQIWFLHTDPMLACQNGP